MLKSSRIYTPLNELTSEEIKDRLKRNDAADLLTLPLSVGEYHSNWKFAQDTCAQLADHESAAIRANAVLGFAYIARTKGQLEKHIVKPLVLRELRENKEYKWRILDSIEDINLFMKWNIGNRINYECGDEHIGC
ncbi:hypothetical protein NST04_23600 [Paenibacillus sp. FSL H7-0756]|uniref:hypothetical protein n=1 Tax=unclassified Paenibacillus TaxID=185978 RepID=UPI0030F79280